MIEHRDFDDRELDDQLADFTDKLLSKDETLEASLAREDAELRALQEMVVLLHKAVGEQQPSPATTSRIRSGLIAEWHQLQGKIKERPARRLVWSRDFLRRLGWSFKRQGRRRLVLGVAAVTTVVLLALVWLFSDAGLELKATAGEGELGLLMILGLLLLGGAIVWWLFRSK